MVNSSIFFCLLFHLPFRNYIAAKPVLKIAEDADPALLEYSHYEETAEPTTTIVTLSLSSDYSLSHSIPVVRSCDGTDTEVNAVTCDSDQRSDLCKNAEESPTSFIDASEN